MPASNFKDKGPAARAWRRSVKIGPDTLSYISAPGFQVLAYIGLLDACARRDHPWQEPFIQCKQRTIADAIGVVRETVNVVINEWLVPLGLLKKEWRGQLRANGQFQTCVYHVTKLARQLIGSPRAPLARKDLAARKANRVRADSQRIVDSTFHSLNFAYPLGYGPPDG